MIEDTVKTLIRDALTEEACHHKQWYLEKIAELIGICISDLDYEKGIAP